MLEKRVKIKVEKNPEPILSPKMFNGKYSSIRNPGAFIYNDQIGLLCTVRHSSDNKSRLHLAWSENKKNFTLDETPFIDLDQDTKMGVEDARITKRDTEYYITFTAFKDFEKKKGNTTRIGLVKTKDFKTYYERKIILNEYGNNKNCVIFQTSNPSIFYVIHRPSESRKRRPSARLAMTEDFENFQDLGIFLAPRKHMWDSRRVGINTPPVRIENNNLLFLYHGADKKNVYRLGGVMIDESNLNEILWRSKEPLIEPELPWETGKCEDKAEVPNVVFGQGLIPLGKNEFNFFYAGGDRYIGMAKITILNN